MSVQRPVHTLYPDLFTRRLGYLAVAFFATVALPVLTPAVQNYNDIGFQPVIIDYFYEEGCPQCRKVNEQVLPELKQQFEGFYVVRKHDIGIQSNVATLVTYQEDLGISDNQPVCMVVDYQYVFNGYSKIKSELAERVQKCVASRLEPGWQPPEPISVEHANHERILLERVRSFTLPMVIAGGLVDGINPCAITSLVFLISFLSVSKVRGRGIILMGISFCIASFLTYTALGFGLLRFLHIFKGFNLVQLGLEIIMMAILGVLAILSFRDAYRYRKSGDSRDVTLQLPDSVKALIHKVIRSGMNKNSLVFGGFIIGVSVTALESICTGQVYVPALVAVIKSGELLSESWKYLLVYNIMFMVPVVTVFALTCFGLRTEKLIQWSRTNVAVSKIILGFFFITMAILIASL